MTKKTGKALENFVTQIEKLFHPETVRIESNDKVMVDGVVYAEFDIVVTGQFGSTTITWLLECRDRPSSGKQGVSWTEQLSGRKNLHGFDKVTAVSTTGFSDPAIRLGIELRKVNNLVEEQVEWESGIQANIILEIVKIKSAKVKLVGEDLIEVESEINKCLGQVDLDQPILNNQESFKNLLLNMYRNHKDFDKLDKSIEINGRSLSISITADYQPDQNYWIQYEGNDYHISSIDLKGAISKINLPQIFLSAYEYKNQGVGENIATQSNLEAPLPDGGTFPIEIINTGDKSIFTISPPVKRKTDTE